MKPKSLTCIFTKSPLIVLAVTLGVPSSLVHAAPRYWDTTNGNGLTAGNAFWDAGTTSAWQSSTTPGTTAPGLWISGDIATFNVGPNTVTVSGTVNAGGMTSNTTGATTIGGTGTIEFTGTIANTAGSQAFTIDSKIKLLGDVSIDNSDATRIIAINGVISGNYGLTKISTGNNDNGILTLGGANTYTGNTNISRGTLRLTANGAIPSASVVLTGAAGSRLELNTYSTTIAGLSGTTGGVNNTSTTSLSTLTIDNSSDFSFSGFIGNTASSALALVKNGTGTQTLSRTTGSHTYAGGTTINAGVLAINGGGALGAGGRNVLVNSGGTLAFLTTSNVQTSYLDRAIDSSTGTFALGVSTTAALNFTGKNNLYLGSTGAFAYTASAANFTPGTNGYLLGGGGGTLSMNTANQMTGAASVTVRGNVTLGVAQNYTGATTVSSGTLLVNNTSNSGTGTAGVTVASGATLGGTGTIAPTVIGGINVSGILAPGSGGIGNLTINLTSATSGTVGMLTNSSFAFELGTANLTIGTIGLNSSDLLTLTGALSGDFAFNGNNVNFLSTGAVGFYKLFDTSSDNANTWTGLTFDGTTGKVNAGLTYSNLAGGLSGDFLVGTASNGGTTGDIYFQVVPEPNVAALLGSLGMLALLRRRRD